MKELKRRLGLVERSQGSQGRLITVRANGKAELDSALTTAGVERHPADTVIAVHREADDRPHVLGIHEEGAGAFFAKIDGRSLPLVKEAV